MRHEDFEMKEPTTEQEILALHNLRRSDPRRYIQIANGWIRKNPRNADAYYGRHIAWSNLGELGRALDDINKSIELDSDPVSHFARARVYRRMGDHKKAIEDYERVKATHPVLSEEDWLSLLYKADSYARLGNEAAALACWKLLPNDIWTPGPNDAPPGNKTEIREELRRIAAEVRRKRV
jgi:tetratricopeptide (TPR) repeat protein